MKWHGWLTLGLGLGLAACDPVVSESGTESGSGGSTSTSGSSLTSPEPPTDSQTASDTLPDPSTTTDGPSVTTTGADPTSASGGDSSSGSSSGAWGSSSSSSSGDAESSTSGSSTSGDSNSGLGFIDPSDTGPIDACDPYAQDCPDGEKCNAYANDGGIWNALGCFPVVVGAGLAGDVCETEGGGASGYDTCDLGLMCWDVDTETGEGTCVPMCEGTADDPTCSEPGTQCTIANDGTLNLCLPPCDPLGQDCDNGQACYPIDNTFVCAPDASGGAGMAGEPCSTINACSAGTACISPDAYGAACPAGSPGCCTPYCEIGEPADCPEDYQFCDAWFDKGTAPDGFETVGVCSAPL